eukprot:TRINITY_DN1517_c3_g1_i2.p1 TRINITY_DN1517_c3_g1~~TRINITY_DN1517_c3_g1_i2.p1  ORF type:complete len:366 (-),score=49.30 TRINITY_DN1517_c3_g1_i2:206-1282(-)
MSFYWTPEADAVLTRVYLQCFDAGKVNFKEVFRNVRRSLAQSEAERSGAGNYASVDEVDLPTDEILTRLAQLPACPQPACELHKIDWEAKQIGDRTLTLTDHLILFWETETGHSFLDYCQGEPSPMRVDWVPFYKNLMLHMALSGLDSSREQDQVLPWVHTCQVQIEKLRRTRDASPKSPVTSIRTSGPKKTHEKKKKEREREKEKDKSSDDSKKKHKKHVMPTFLPSLSKARRTYSNTLKKKMSKGEIPEDAEAGAGSPEEEFSFDSPDYIIGRKTRHNSERSKSRSARNSKTSRSNSVSKTPVESPKTSPLFPRWPQSSKSSKNLEKELFLKDSSSTDSNYDEAKSSSSDMPILHQ